MTNDVIDACEDGEVALDRSGGRLPAVSILIPTLDEAGAIGDVLAGVRRAVEEAGLSAEILVIDDGSIDGTREIVAGFGPPVRLIEREPDRGLAGAILAGALVARAEVVVVMDGDGSHPVGAVVLLAMAIREGRCDTCIGSRYVPGGSTAGWPFLRRLLSRTATLAARPITVARDPMSGFFATTRHRLLGVERSAAGFKIGLEILAGDPGQRVEEVPICFQERTAGVSKLGMRVVRDYLSGLHRLAGGTITGRSSVRFAIVGATGVAVDAGVFAGVHGMGGTVVTAHLSGFFAATLWNYLLNARWTFGGATGLGTYVRFLVVCLLALALRGGVIAIALRMGVPIPAALLLGIGSAAAVNYLGSAFYVFQSPRLVQPTVRWRVAAVGVIAISLALRLIYAGLLELIPEEAYYWNYARHLDIGYLDHPPLVAWTIAGFRAILGDTEFAIRSGAIAWWSVGAFCLARYARELYGRKAVLPTLLLFALLPYCIGAGFTMSPDAPLMACWAGALWGLSRALVRDKASGWIAAGLFIGAGLLAKYTIALLGLAAVVACCWDRAGRRWLTRPQPWLAAALALAVFSPVVLWNWRNDWASFRFQGPGRWEGNASIQVHALFGSMAALVTPVAFAAIGLIAVRRWRGSPAPAERRRTGFIASVTLVPLAIFVIYACRHEPRLNWTGPIWLAVLPAIARTLAAARSASLPARIVSRSWGIAVPALLVAYGAICHYLVLGQPGTPVPSRLIRLVGWRDLGQAIERIGDEVEARYHEEPLIVGLGKYQLASELAFYHPEQEGQRTVLGDGYDQTTSSHLFGYRGLMYERWFPMREQHGRLLLLVSYTRHELEEDWLREYAARLDPIIEIPIEHDGVRIGSYFCRVAHHYGTPSTKAGAIVLRE